MALQGSNKVWGCTVCGYAHRGPIAPKSCPVCCAAQAASIGEREADALRECPESGGRDNGCPWTVLTRNGSWHARR